MSNETSRQQSKFKQFGTKVKTSVSNTKRKVSVYVSDTKRKATAYKSELEKAYNQGYRAGWDAHENLPNVKGARTAAKCGYSHGMRDHKRDDKYRNRIK